jgi:hypothetical protein
MPIGTCDPATRGEAHNSFEVDFLEGRAKLIGVYDWDGVSVKPSCDGPLVSLRGVNLTTDLTLYGWFLGRNGTARSITMPPGFDQTIINPQLRNLGFRNYSDCDGITVTTTNINPF